MNTASIPSIISRPDGLPILFAATLLGWPVAAQDPFVPGSGDPVPNLAPWVETPGLVGGLRVEYNHRRKLFMGSGTRVEIEFEFPAPAVHGAAGYRFQISPDGINWEDIPAGDEWLETQSDSQDNLTIYPSAGLWHYRFVVQHGPKHGSVSNAEAIHSPIIDTRFAGWGLDQSMWITGVMAPWVGYGMEASFTVRKLEDDSEVADALGYQWYRVHPHTYEKTPIPGATDPTYVTTEADVGGWLLMCQGTGDGANADGFGRVVSGMGVRIANPAFATDIHSGGFRLNLLRAVPSLAPADLIVRYYNAAWQEIILPVTAVTPVGGTAVFDVDVSIPAEVEQLTVSNDSEVWQLATRMFEDHVMESLMIDIPRGEGFGSWIAGVSEIPADRRGPDDRNGPLELPNLLAYAMGLNPIEATAQDLPQVAGAPDSTLKIRFRRATGASGAELILQACDDLGSWQTATVLGTTVIEAADGSELVEVEVSPPDGGCGFFRLEAVATGAGEPEPGLFSP